jgi:hypothetical protein
MFIVSLVCIFFGTKGIVSGEVIRLHRGSASIVSFDLEPITFCMNVGALFFMASILAGGCIKVFSRAKIANSLAIDSLNSIQFSSTVK